MIVYTNKGLSMVHEKFHPMEGECYALVWGIMHFNNTSIKTILHSTQTINHLSG
jgi:hypothetical protein